MYGLIFCERLGLVVWWDDLLWNYELMHRNLLLSLSLSCFIQLWVDFSATNVLIGTKVEFYLQSCTILIAFCIWVDAGSILSVGGSGPFENAKSSDWAQMVDTFQKAALQSRLGIPLLYGIDAVHGNNNVYGATVFPHNIGLGATRLSLVNYVNVMF